MEYFGTNLTSAGHYRWNLNNDYLQSGSIDFHGLPFNPEGLTKDIPKGGVIFYQGGGFTVLGISGSCSDDRPGTKSIFWVKEIISKSKIIDKIKSNKLASEIINKMPFEINWGS